MAERVKMGSTCEIRPMDLNQGDKNKHTIFLAKVLMVNNDGTVDLSIPTFMDEQIDLERNTRYSFLFIEENSFLENDKTLKVAQGVFLQRIRIDNKPMAKIRLVTEVNKIQRRDFFRIGCRINMYFQTISLRHDDFRRPDYIRLISENIDNDAWKEGTILDISGGGMKFQTETPIVDLPYIYGTFLLEVNGKDKRIGVSGKVLSRQPVPRSLLCTHRIKFEPQTSKAQNDILAYVYAKQRLVVKK